MGEKSTDLDDVRQEIFDIQESIKTIAQAVAGLGKSDPAPDPKKPKPPKETRPLYKAIVDILSGKNSD